MKVLITGASGFVGSHTAAALVGAGHEVRAFVRSAENLATTLRPLGSPPVEVAVGDVLDGAAVAESVDGCDAVVNAANVYTLSTRRKGEMDRVNVAGTEAVLAAAAAAGCDPIVHVSTYLTLLSGGDPIPADPPVGGRSNHAYTDSKIGGEEIARRFQAGGAPVVITYPGQVFGPHDPKGGEMVSLSRLLLASPPLALRGRLGIVDVRWLAGLHVRLVESGHGAHRVLAPGHLTTWTELSRTMRSLTGRRPPVFLPTPYVVAATAGRVAQAVARRTGREIGTNAEGPWILKNWQPGDDGLARGLTGEMPPLLETLTDAMRSMVEAGQLTRRHAGDLAHAADAS